MTRQRKQRCEPRQGLTLSELVIALAIAVTAMVGVAQLMHTATRQHRAVGEQNFVAMEAANIMEDLMSRPWDELASGKAPEIELSAACIEAVPNAEVEVEIIEEDGLKDARRVVVEIKWLSHPSDSPKPFRLVAWKYKP